MAFFIKTETIKREYLLNIELKKTIINDHIIWVKQLKNKGVIDEEDDSVDYTLRMDKQGNKIDPFKDWENTTYLGRLFKSFVN